MNRPIVFVDTETTSLGHEARAWEIAFVRREIDGTVNEHVLQQTYALAGLPEGTTTEALLVGGWMTRGVRPEQYLDQLPPQVSRQHHYNEKNLATSAARRLIDQPILVGVGVHFDAAVLSALFVRNDMAEQPWHYAIVDLKAVTYGVVRARLALEADNEDLRDAARLPMSSERLAAALGVTPPTDDERHTALGDARWAARWFDALPTDATETRDS